MPDSALPPETHHRHTERAGGSIPAFHHLGAGLPHRELEVCARAAYGMSVEATALDLKLGRASVLTYRKRAYARLGVSSANELCKIIME